MEPYQALANAIVELAVKDYKKALEAVNAKSIQKTLKALVKQGNVAEIVMMPAK